jgi:hypothetical protein
MPPKKISTKKLQAARDRFIKRHGEGKFKDVMELANIMIPRYMEKAADIDIVTPFGGWIKFGRFDNSKGAKLQLKVSTNEKSHSGSDAGVKWSDYKTFCEYLDQIDVIDARDYSPSSTKSKVLDKLAKRGLEVLDKYDEEKIDSKKLEEEKKKFFSDGAGRKEFARQLLEAISYVPKEMEEMTAEEIPQYLNKLMSKIGNKLKIYDTHETNQIRAASMMFGVAICEAFRTPGALKHFRQCLRIVESEGETFSKVFGDSLKESICLLSPKKGTAATKKVFESGVGDLSKEQMKGWELSDSSDDEMPEARAVRIKGAKKLEKASQHIK